MLVCSAEYMVWPTWDIDGQITTSSVLPGCSFLAFTSLRDQQDHTSNVPQDRYVHPLTSCGLKQVDMAHITSLRSSVMSFGARDKGALHMQMAHEIHGEISLPIQGGVWSARESDRLQQQSEMSRTLPSRDLSTQRVSLEGESAQRTYIVVAHRFLQRDRRFSYFRPRTLKKESRINPQTNSFGK